MAIYRLDTDLAFLRECSNEELGLLVSVLTHDSKDGQKRWTETLTSSPEYQLYHPEHQQYWMSIAAELQAFGANSLMSFVRGNKGVLYREILQDVCDHLDVNYPKEGNTETLELNLLLKVLEKSLNELTTEELQAFSRDMQLNLTNPTPQLILIAVQAAIRTSGIAALEVATLSAIGVINALGGVATIGTLFAAHRALSLIAGPIGLAVSSAWLVADLAGPAYRVTVPACIIVAYLRQKALSQ
ncbi:DUF3944 domain-containing protein [Providencia rettgeri]|uniref:DUF3944 domain-containing protein n=1 Tax=Providencia TaxID=586 RepID=UPI001CFE6E83|nr:MULTISPECIES: DUF3944 domain-containing protein [Providencia]EMB8479500.1 DUF3944 domain-containing protein [Providencia rettgeri]MCB4855687.1 DUF3944 domain-containing protein [Providencia rettgeri]MCD6316646.1 DUF3944 domain-containing protein [Providencia rettgeri]MCG9534767.1 DUF3944 domain-containing protein [Providencia huaxiensis]